MTLKQTSKKLLDSEYSLFRNFIATHFGIYFDEDKRWLLESKLARILDRYSFESFSKYYEYLQKSDFSYKHPSSIALLREITNNETFFFRELAALEVIKQTILPQLVEKKAKALFRTIRILSAACSTGEEVYSLAIMACESGKLWPNYRLQIIGIDIDPGPIELSKIGRYKPKSFRGVDDHLLKIAEKYFSPVQRKDVLLDSASSQFLLTSESSIKSFVRKLVDFQQCNILNLHELKDLGVFDIIFCRNVLIYFNQQGKETAIENFSKILNTGGYLFLGTSESILGKNTPFTPVEMNGHIFYQKTE